MKFIHGVTIAVGILAGGAFAQDLPLQTSVQMDQMKMRLEKMAVEAKVMSLGGGVMGPAVKGAPYSADEVRSNTQVLADGTTIHNETKTTVYRDGSGRVRRETPDEISIWDPGAGTNYVLNPKTMQAHQMSLHLTFSRSTSVGGPGEKGQTATFTYSSTSKNGEAPVVIMSGDPAIAGAVTGGPVMRKVLRDREESGKKESLGVQSFEGVNAEGERVTSTIEANAIGNDRPIQTVTERWYSQELQTNLMTKRTDPRSGEEVFKLTNIHRGEPSPVLFEVPPSYTIVNAK